MKIETVYVRGLVTKDDQSLIKADLHTEHGQNIKIFFEDYVLVSLLNENCSIIFNNKDNYAVIHKIIEKRSKLEAKQLAKFLEIGRINISD